MTIVEPLTGRIESEPGGGFPVGSSAEPANGSGDDRRRAPSPSLPRPSELLFREARRRRRRRWLAGGLAISVVGGVLFVLLTGVGGTTGTMVRSRSAGDRGNSNTLPPVRGPAAMASAVALGAGPTSIDFVNANLGWIATGCSANFCYRQLPTIVRTDDGGRSWQRISAPDVGSVYFSGYTWMNLGGNTTVRFLNREVGWYSQVGELWNTTDGGKDWHRTRIGGAVTDLTTEGATAWALVSDCPGPVALSCRQLHLYRWTSGDPSWARLSRAVDLRSTDNPTSATLRAAGSSVYLGVADQQYRIAHGGEFFPVSSRCQAIDGLTPGQLIGICNVGDDASNTQFALSRDEGRHWTTILSGPPVAGAAQRWSGGAHTNGSGTIWYVVGGSTLWRTTVTGGVWSAVYRTPAGSTDELYPVVLAGGQVGFMGESGSARRWLLKTVDGGLHWNRIAVGSPSGP